MITNIKYFIKLSTKLTQINLCSTTSSIFKEYLGKHNSLFTSSVAHNVDLFPSTSNKSKFNRTPFRNRNTQKTIKDTNSNIKELNKIIKHLTLLVKELKQNDKSEINFSIDQRYQKQILYFTPSLISIATNKQLIQILKIVQLFKNNSNYLISLINGQITSQLLSLTVQEVIHVTILFIKITAVYTPENRDYMLKPYLTHALSLINDILLKDAIFILKFIRKQSFQNPFYKILGQQMTTGLLNRLNTELSGSIDNFKGCTDIDVHAISVISSSIVEFKVITGDAAKFFIKTEKICMNGIELFNGEELSHLILAYATVGFPSEKLFIKLGNRAGLLGDNLNVNDVIRVMKALDMVKLDTANIKASLESSMRLRSMYKRNKYHTV